MEPRRRRLWYAAAGVLASALWFGCWAATVLPGSSAVTRQWAAGNALALLAGMAFGAAAVTRSDS